MKKLSKSEALEVARAIVQLLCDNKGKDAVGIDIELKTSLAYYMIICTASSKRHAWSLYDKVVHLLRDAGLLPVGVEGERESDWTLIDASTIIINIMQQEARDMYRLVDLWGEPSIIGIPTQTQTDIEQHESIESAIEE